MSAEGFGRAIGSGGRSVPTYDGFETMECMERHEKSGDLMPLNAIERHQARLYLEAPIGRLICALWDASEEARNMGGDPMLFKMLGAMWQNRIEWLKAQVPT